MRPEGPLQDRHSSTLGVLGLVFGGLMVAGALWALATAVRRWIAPHGVEWSSSTAVLFAIGALLFVMGLSLVTRGVEETRKATGPPVAPFKPMAPAVPYRPERSCPGCGRWDDKITRGCPECAQQSRSA